VLRLSEITFKGQIASGVTQNIYITNDEEIKDGDWAYHKIFGVGKITHIHGEYSFVSIKRNSTDGTITTPWRRNIPDIKKIILTTDQDLIKDSVQTIDDEFLEWFVKNPSCESVEVIYEPKNFLDTKQGWEYEIIIPKEEPKLTNVCIKCGVDLYYADNFACQEHPKNCKGIHLSEETLKERALKEEPKQETLEEAFERNAQYLDDFENKNTYEYGFRDGAKWQQEQDKNKYSEEDLDMFRKFMIQEQNFSKSCLNVFIEQFKKK
jgi:hypothetical protein